jgi:hypothetical protein
MVGSSSSDEYKIKRWMMGDGNGDDASTAGAQRYAARPQTVSRISSEALPTAHPSNSSKTKSLPQSIRLQLRVAVLDSGCSSGHQEHGRFVGQSFFT